MSEHRARKRFGQNFLSDPNIIRKIVDAIHPQPGETMVEIGPGLGAMTDPIVERIGHLHVVEIDRDLIARLKQRYGPDKLSIHEGDALAFDFGALGADLRVVGNLPYNISTPLLFHLRADRTHTHDLTAMLQKEVTDPIAAAPGSKEYGRLGVMLAPWFTVTKLFDVGPGAFRPPPRVWSAVARLMVLPEPRFEVPASYAAVVAQAFSQRRKTLRNSLRMLVTAEDIAASGIDPGARPETLTPQQFAQLAALAREPPG